MRKTSYEHADDIDFDHIDDDLNATRGSLAAVGAGLVVWIVIAGLFFYFLQI